MPGPHKTASLSVGLSALVGVILIWSSIPVVLKHFTAYLDAWTVMGLRFSLATLFLVPVVLRHEGYGACLARPDIWRRAVVPAVVHFCGQVLWSLAPYHNQASVVMFVGRCAFFFSVVFGFWLLEGERHLVRRPLFWVGVTGTVAGLVLMFAGSSASRGTSRLGLWIMLGTSLFWGLYGVTIKRYMGPFPARLSFGVVSLYTLPGFVLIMLTRGNWQQLFALSAGNWALLIVASCASVGLGHVFSYTAIQRFGPVLTEGVYNLIPFLASGLAFLFLGDAMTSLQWAGGLLILGGSVGFLVTLLRVEKGGGKG